MLVKTSFLYGVVEERLTHFVFIWGRPDCNNAKKLCINNYFSFVKSKIVFQFEVLAICQLVNGEKSSVLLIIYAILMFQDWFCKRSYLTFF